MITILTLCISEIQLFVLSNVALMAKHCKHAAYRERALMTDNGSAMTCDEFRSGLHTLSIVHETKPLSFIELN